MYMEQQSGCYTLYAKGIRPSHSTTLNLALKAQPMNLENKRISSRKYVLPVPARPYF